LVPENNIEDWEGTIATTIDLPSRQTYLAFYPPCEHAVEVTRSGSTVWYTCPCNFNGSFTPPAGLHEGNVEPLWGPNMTVDEDSTSVLGGDYDRDEDSDKEEMVVTPVD